MTETTLRTPIAPLQRRQARLKRELRALHLMDGSLRTRELFWAVLTIPGVALLVLGVAAKAHWLAQTPVITIIAAAATGLLVWWVGRRWLGLALLIVLGLFLILLEDVPDTGWAARTKAKNVGASSWNAPSHGVRRCSRNWADTDHEQDTRFF